ncbi:uncharacterized protein LOC132314525 [Cornus florida]|uniref:uncharacterized protein LOC132314525 n=1 Tax=Cornus florida TaxID=4283 RepID=UPI00289E24A2|nr:uncharacterized protein LOC132314525 [Cornus florida]
MIHGMEDIKIQVVNHFQSLLGYSAPPTHHISDLAPFISKAVPTNMHFFLEDPPSNLEIQSCILKLNKDRAPGPDGYNALFLQKCWNIVGRTIIKAISEFFRNGKLLAEVNNTYIALVPKCQNPASLHDYRPISCVNTIYKCISKLLATRLQSTLPLLIDQAQSAFVHGRKITDPILLAHELLRGYHKHGTPVRCAIKVDLKKAFDSMKWDFIISCLSLHNFPPKFISLINACISSPSFTIALNGEFQGYFKGKRGLRQGDPISPFQFVLVMDAFSSIITNYKRFVAFRYYSVTQDFARVTFALAALLRPSFHRFLRFVSCLASRSPASIASYSASLLVDGKSSKIDCCSLVPSGVMISILAPALFRLEEPSTLSVLKSALDLFCSMSGLNINLSKSAVYFSGVNDHTQYEISSLLGIQAATLPVKYLGVPLISTNLKAQHCSLLVSRITHRVINWTSRSLSYAELKTSGSKVAWRNVCSPKPAGGLGIPNLEIANKAGILRFIWDLQTDNSNRLWVNWCHSHLLKARNMWTLNFPQPCSWSWRKMLQLRHTAKGLIKHSIGNGVDTTFWWDNWAPGGPLSLRFPRSLMSDGGLHEDITVDNFITNNNWAFPIFLTNVIPELANLPAPDSSTRDTKMWIASPTGQYSFSHTISHLVRDLPNVPWYNLVWQSPTIPRMKFILWLTVQSKLPTLDSAASTQLLGAGDLLFNGQVFNGKLIPQSICSGNWGFQL